MSGEIVTFDENEMEKIEEPSKKFKKKRSADEVKEELLTKRSKEQPLQAREFLSSGSTLLNLQCTGHPNKCYAKGTYNHIVGDSDAGKTFLSLTAFGEASINKSFDSYRFLYFLGEPGGALMDKAGCFGKKAADRIEQVCVTSPEQFYDELHTKHEEGIPYIAILDSMDSLMPTVEFDKFEEDKEARSKGKDTGGSYQTAKPKTNSSLLRVAVSRLADNGSILSIISQTRDNIGFGSQFNPKVYSGGHAMKFYATLQIWLSSKGDIKKTVKGKDRQLGIYSKLHVKKNHITGAKGSVEVPIYHCPGMMDDTGSCIEFLINEGKWSSGKGRGIVAPEFDFEGTEEKLAQKIDSEGRHRDLQVLVSDTWNDIKEACKLVRKPRYE